jgi:hypothetical protein
MHVTASGPGRQGGDHLIGVHVGTGARAGLEYVDGELRIMVARRHVIGSRRDRLSKRRVEHPQFGIDPGAGALDQSQRADLRAFKAAPRNRKIFHRALCLRTV